MSMPLIEERERASRGTGVDGLPQPVEYKDRLIELGIHDLVDAATCVASRAIPFLSTVEV